MTTQEVSISLQLNYRKIFMICGVMYLCTVSNASTFGIYASGYDSIIAKRSTAFKALVHFGRPSRNDVILGWFNLNSAGNLQ